MWEFFLIFKFVFIVRKLEIVNTHKINVICASVINLLFGLKIYLLNCYCFLKMKALLNEFKNSFDIFSVKKYFFFGKQLKGKKNAMLGYQHGF